MRGKDFLSVNDLDCAEIQSLVQRAKDMKGTRALLLSDMEFVLLFEKPSLRTRVSFEVGIRQLGGNCTYLSKDDVGLGNREPAADVARVLDRWVDGIIARVFSHESLEIVAANTSKPVVNALSDREHPCQAIGDMLTIYEHKGGLKGLSLAFIGDGNNVASSLALACASLGVNFTLASPTDYRIPDSVFRESERRASINGASIRLLADPLEAVAGADVVYTDTWVSMGDESEKSLRMKIFEKYRVDENLLALSNHDSIFMHDMPAYRGQEISEMMIDHERSVVFDQSENRMHAQKAVLATLFS